MIIEEEEPGPHFAEYQLGLDVIPSKGDIARIQALATLASPVRSRLKRLYNNAYDVRRFKLDQSTWGDLLSDYSGVMAGELILSFGRTTPCRVVAPLVQLTYSAMRYFFDYARLEDIYLLDYARLGDTQPSLENARTIATRQRVVYNWTPLTPLKGSLLPITTFAKAMIVLSESPPLGDINSCFAVTDVQEKGNSFTLNQDILSEHAWKFCFTPLLERFYHTTSLQVENTSQPIVITLTLRKYIVRLPCALGKGSFTSFTQAIYQRAFFTRVRYTGVAGWHGHYHVNRKWKERNSFVIGLSHKIHGVKVTRLFQYPVLSQHVRQKLSPVQVFVLSIIALSCHRKQFSTTHYVVPPLSPLLHYHRQIECAAHYLNPVATHLNIQGNHYYSVSDIITNRKVEPSILRHYFTQTFYMGVTGWHFTTHSNSAWTKEEVIVNRVHKQGYKE